ncbi:hypothetical protein C2S51_002071 [Perilla frutescens var. frutescens]|nr:hypothetical protein C2S51_002071 [Perilla frutescens var. frutescens]
MQMLLSTIGINGLVGKTLAQQISSAFNTAWQHDGLMGCNSMLITDDINPLMQPAALVNVLRHGIFRIFGKLSNAAAGGTTGEISPGRLEMSSALVNIAFAIKAKHSVNYCILYFASGIWI